MGKEESTTKTSFKKQFISKNELLSWLNSLLQIKLTLVEQLGSGSVYCQILDVVHPGSIPLVKVKWQAKVEYDFLHNFRLLQQGFDKFEIAKNIPANKLAKTKYQDNLEFGQWMKGYFDMNCKEKGKGYNAVNRRGNQIPDFSFCKGGVLPKQTLFFRNPNDKSQQSHMFMEECSIGADNGCLPSSYENSQEEEKQHFSTLISKDQTNQQSNFFKNTHTSTFKQTSSESKTLNTSFFSDQKEASTNNSFDFKDSFELLNKSERKDTSKDNQLCQFFTRKIEDKQEHNNNNTFFQGTISAQLNNNSGLKETNDKSSLIVSQHTQLGKQSLYQNNQSTQVVLINPSPQINFFGREDSTSKQQFSIPTEQKIVNIDNINKPENIQNTANITTICQPHIEPQHKNIILKQPPLNFNSVPTNSDSSFYLTLQQKQLPISTIPLNGNDIRFEENLNSTMNIQDNRDSLTESREFPIKKPKIESNIFFLRDSTNSKEANTKSSQMKVQQIKDILLDLDIDKLKDYDIVLKQILSICNSN